MNPIERKDAEALCKANAPKLRSIGASIASTLIALNIDTSNASTEKKDKP